MLEKEVDQKIVGYAKKKYNALVVKLSMLGRFGIAGLPDRMFLGPGRVIFFMEMKRPGGQTDAKQRYMCQLLANFGFHTYIVDDIETGRAIVDMEFGNAIQSPQVPV